MAKQHHDLLDDIAIAVIVVLLLLGIVYGSAR